MKEGGVGTWDGVLVVVVVDVGSSLRCLVHGV